MNAITQKESTPNYKSIKAAIWLYFLLWIFEGALRKWILPGLATPLLVVRDPVAIFIILRAFYLNVKFLNVYIILALVFTLLGLVITLTFGHGNLFVGLYGARIMLLHFPLIFIIGEVLKKEDLLKLGRVMLMVNILVTVIVYFQFISPQTSFINVGIGGEGSAGFSGSMGYFRPSGTFSFTTGLSAFYIFLSVFVFYFWLSKEACSKILLIASTIALLIALPLTVSRTSVGGVILVGFFTFLGSSTSFKSIIRLAFTLVLIGGLFVFLQKTTVIFSLGTEVFMSRVETANGQSGSVKDSFFARALSGFTEPIISLFHAPLFVGNLGMGTNAGSQLLVGKRKFLVSEGELNRLSGEQGFIFGGGLIVLRLVLAFNLLLKSIKLPGKYKLLPMTLCGTALFLITQGQWAQPSILGCSVIVTGLLAASINIKPKTA
ncbi:hypothetical protein [Flavobacterium hercynium]|uniref:O-antigen ligase domain-containing protein n=1 Tax=Flavobacterium hercynium TaxID=387094 RepID=A0A226H3Y2_9FLAO|nr:hypothetical protein [Flavobacterium hercynium]OXA88977.1 hypothetical protein B0A66_14655 [Flavobacterium hercynium]SMP28175.1 hypothetical protein SAMN06265346_11140 [Flavobacterium hercynium]